MTKKLKRKRKPKLRIPMPGKPPKVEPLKTAYTRKIKHKGQDR